MAQPKMTRDAHGKPIHYSAGAVIRVESKYLLIDRKIPPPGFAGIAGHIDEGETPEEAIVREIREESGFTAQSIEKLYEELLDWNWCSKGIQQHHWHLFRCTVEGSLRQNRDETKSIGWYSAADIRSLPLEQVWKYWFAKLGIL